MKRAPLPPSVQECLVQASGRLSAAGIPDAEIEARLMLQSVCGCSLTGLLTRLRQPLAPDLQQSVEAMLQRRLRREPLPYITGRAWFYGRQFFVDRRVLIPRPESELLVERALALAGAAAFNEAPARVLDVGTGSGALAVSLALEVPGAVVDAVDVSPDALHVARLNAAAHGVSHRVNLIRSDLGSCLRGGYRLAVANLPYVPEGVLPDLPPEIAAHEPRRALAGGRDGVAVIRRLIALAPELLRSGGWLLLEIGEGQSEAVMSALDSQARWSDVSLQQDLAGIPRIVSARLSP